MLGAEFGWGTSAREGIFQILTATGLSVLTVVLARSAGAHLGVLLAWGCLGAGLATLEGAVDVPPFLQEGEKTALEGEVWRVERFEDSTRLLLAVARAGPGEGSPARFLAQVTAQGEPPELLPGQRVRVEARLKALTAASNPGRRMSRVFAAAPGTRLHGELPRRGDAGALPAPPWRRELARLQEGLARAVRAVAPTPESAALFLTLAAGQRAALDDTLEEDFSRSGLAHVLSVSGLHVAALALMTLALLRQALVQAGSRVRALRRLDARRLAAPTAVPFVWAYVVFTGNQPPAVRSAVMATGVLLGLALWRRADGLNSLAAAAVLLVVWAPSSVGDLSLQLSFLAVFSLLLLTPTLREALPLSPPDAREPRRVKRWLGQARETVLETFCASSAVILASLPLVAATFGRVSLAGLVSNIVCLPLCGVLTGFAAGGAALYVALPVLATPLLWGGAWASQVLLWLTRFFAHVPLATVDLPAFGTSASLLYASGLACWALGERRGRLGGLLAPVGMALALLVPRLLPEPGLRITFLSVGQGDGWCSAPGDTMPCWMGAACPAAWTRGCASSSPSSRPRALIGWTWPSSPTPTRTMRSGSSPRWARCPPPASGSPPAAPRAPCPGNSSPPPGARPWTRCSSAPPPFNWERPPWRCSARRWTASCSRAPTTRAWCCACAMATSPCCCPATWSARARPRCSRRGGSGR